MDHVNSTRHTSLGCSGTGDKVDGANSGRVPFTMAVKAMVITPST